MRGICILIFVTLLAGCEVRQGSFLRCHFSSPLYVSRAGLREIRPVPKRHAIKTFLKKRKRPKDRGKSLRDRGGRLCYILGVIGNFLLIFSGSFFADGCF
jgi:hypothetical protein